MPPVEPLGQVPIPALGSSHGVRVKAVVDDRDPTVARDAKRGPRAGRGTCAELGDGLTDPLSERVEGRPADLLAQAAGVRQQRRALPGRSAARPTRPARAGRPRADHADELADRHRSPEPMLTGPATSESSSATNAAATSAACRKSRTCEPSVHGAGSPVQDAKRDRWNQPVGVLVRPVEEEDAAPRGAQSPLAPGRLDHPPQRVLAGAVERRRPQRRPAFRRTCPPRSSRTRRRCRRATARRPPAAAKAPQQLEARLDPAQVLGASPELAGLGIPGEVEQVRRPHLRDQRLRRAGLEQVGGVRVDAVQFRPARARDGMHLVAPLDQRGARRAGR